MIAMRMMQMTIDQIVDVISMRDGLVTATRAMYMVGIVAGTLVTAGAIVRIGLRYLHRMLVTVVSMRMVQMAVNQVVHMVAVLDRDMTAAGTVLMSIIVLVCVVLVLTHGKSLKTCVARNLTVAAYAHAVLTTSVRSPLPRRNSEKGQGCEISPSNAASPGHPRHRASRSRTSSNRPHRPKRATTFHAAFALKGIRSSPSAMRRAG